LSLKFYNPRTSMLDLGVSYLNSTIQISMAPTLDPNMKGRPTKGQKVYDWENGTQWFALSVEECHRTFQAIPGLLDGTYSNPDPKTPAEYKQTYNVTHFRENRPSRMLLNRSKDSNGNPTGTLTLTLFPPTGAKPINYTFRSDELPIFISFIKHGFVDLPYNVACWDGQTKAEWKNKQDREKRQKNNGNNYNNQQNEPVGSTFDNAVPVQAAAPVNTPAQPVQSTSVEGLDFNLNDW